MEHARPHRGRAAVVSQRRRHGARPAGPLAEEHKAGLVGQERIAEHDRAHPNPTSVRERVVKASARRARSVDQFDGNGTSRPPRLPGPHEQIQRHLLTLSPVRAKQRDLDFVLAHAVNDHVSPRLQELDHFEHKGGITDTYPHYKNPTEYGLTDASEQLLVRGTPNDGAGGAPLVAEFPVSRFCRQDRTKTGTAPNKTRQERWLTYRTRG